MTIGRLSGHRHSRRSEQTANVMAPKNTSMQLIERHPSILRLNARLLLHYLSVTLTAVEWSSGRIISALRVSEDLSESAE